jgi:hypothetical protein
MQKSQAEEQTRAARNQALFRDVNERVEQLNEMFEQLTPFGTWTCECADLECIERIEMTIAEYEQLRQQPNRFAIFPHEAHYYPEAERIVEETDRYWVVDKIGEAGKVASSLDARST